MSGVGVALCPSCRANNHAHTQGGPCPRCLCGVRYVAEIHPAVVSRQALALAIHEAEGKHSGFQHTTGFWLGVVDGIAESVALQDMAAVAAAARDIVLEFVSNGTQRPPGNPARSGVAGGSSRAWETFGRRMAGVIDNAHRMGAAADPLAEVRRSAAAAALDSLADDEQIVQGDPNVFNALRARADEYRDGKRS